MIKKYINKAKFIKYAHIIPFWRDIYDKPAHINKLPARLTAINIKKMNIKYFKNQKNRTSIFFLIAILIVVISSCDKDYLTINAFEAEGTTIKYQLSDTTSTLQVAVVSMNCSKQKSENFSKIFQSIDSIMHTDSETELICFGETTTGWYAETPNYIANIAEQIPGSLTDSIAYYNRKYGIYISLGMAERKNDLFYNSLVVLNPTGEIIAVHRKNTLTSDDENSGYSPLQNSQIININDFKIGLMICADVNGEWLTKQYINGDIDVILSAFASPIGLPSVNIISRRMDAWQIFPNRYGNENGFEYSGLIYISDPAGNIVKYQIGKETYFTYIIAK